MEPKTQKTIKFNNFWKRISPVYKKFMNDDHMEQIFFGGSSSGKSYFLAQRCVIDVLRGRNYLVLRKTGNSISGSVYNEVTKKIDDLFPQYNIKNQIWDINKSTMTITCKLNKAQIVFKGLDDPEKVKSVTPIRGVITDIWVEEATETNYTDWKQLDKRLRGELKGFQKKFKKRLIFSFNPILKSHWLYKEFFQGKWQENKNYYEQVDDNSDFMILKTTYKDNSFLEADDIKRLTKEKDPYYRSVYLDGNWGILEDVIYTNWRISEFDRESFGSYRFGIDWGFADDPFAFIRLAVDLKKMQIWICNEIYQQGLLNDKTIPIVRGISNGAIVWCDSAEPKSIHEFVVNGVNARGVKKGQGSVAEGINFIKKFEIIIHPSCQNFINEIEQYHYKKDAKTGETLPDVVEKKDHLMDAMRYSLEADMLMSFGFHEIL